ncbi:MAG: ABC transporter permease [Pseudomonadota bacterium]
MNGAVPDLTVTGLALAFVPAAIVIGIMYLWRAKATQATYATLRMLVQLLLVGYVLVFIFETNNWLVVAGVLSLMLVIASWIATRTLAARTPQSYINALIANLVGGVATLVFVTQAVIDIQPWFNPRYVVPLAGMTIAGSMTAISLAAERYEAEVGHGVEAAEARRIAFGACMIPMVNSLFAVGLVSLPGMMTGQILSGVSPLIAAQYQIVVMTMWFGATGISAALFLTLQKKD